MGIVYLLADHFEAPPEPFRTGQAGCAWLREDGALEQDVRVHLSANSTHALLGHGVVDALNELPIEEVERVVAEITGTPLLPPSPHRFNARSHNEISADEIKATPWAYHETAVLWDRICADYAEAGL